jgi:hypothetical protein
MNKLGIILTGLAVAGSTIAVAEPASAGTITHCSKPVQVAVQVDYLGNVIGSVYKSTCGGQRCTLYYGIHEGEYGLILMRCTKHGKTTTV